MKKILLLQQHYFPEMAGVARRAKELSEQFVKNGYSVTVLTSYPREFRSLPGFYLKRFEVINRVKIHRIKTIFHVGKSPIFRMLSYFFYVVGCIVYISKNHKQFDIVLSMAPLPPAIAGGIAQKFFNKYHHFDVPDILPDLGISAGMIKNKILIKILFKLEKWVYNHSNSISAITIGQIKNIMNKGVPERKIHFIPDWIDADFFKNNLQLYKVKINRKLDQDKKIITFVGNIGALQNPKVFLHVMNVLFQNGYKNYQFLFIGDGILLPELKILAKKLKLENVDFIGRVKREYIPAYMSLSDVLVANYLANEYMDICIPGKLYEYAISGRPIVMGSNGEAKKLIQNYNLGIGVNPSNVDEFVKAILEVSSKSFKKKSRTENFIEQFSLPTITKKYYKIFRSIK